MEPYVYKPLDLSSDSIRVLRLKSELDLGSDIQCELIETFLGEVPYEALSYTWGSKDKPFKITVDASELHITANLYTALQYLRRPYEDRLLWVDAICINQHSDKERGHQVGQMRLVYQKAEGVLIWLGLSNANIDDFFEAMNDPRLKVVKTAGSEAVSYKNNTELRRKYQATFSRLMARSWFRRVWIIQEVASARIATLLCGRNSISTRIFALIPTIFGLEVPDRCQAVLDIMPRHSRQSSWWGEKQDLHTLLVKFAASEATDERDKIYALLGISSDAHNSKVLFPDYGKKTQQVIHDTWSYLLSRLISDRPLPDHLFPSLSMNEFLPLLTNLPERTFGWASRKRQDQIILRLLGTDFGTPGMYSGSALLCAMAGHPGDDDLFECIVSHEEEDVNVKDDGGDTPLHKAVRRANHDKVKALLKREDILLNITNFKQATALIEAVEYGLDTMVDLLLAHPRVDVNCGGKRRTPIALAIWLGYEVIVKALLARKDIDIKRGGLTQLQEAIRTNHPGILRQLLGSGLVDSKYWDDGGAACKKALGNGREPLRLLLGPDWKYLLRGEVGAILEEHFPGKQKLFGF